MFGRALAGALGVAVCSVAGACHNDVPTEVPSPPARQPGATPLVGAPKTPPIWVVSAASLRRHRSLAPRLDAMPEGAIVDGLRVSFPDGKIAEDVAEPALIGGTRIPQHLGGGHLFWSSSAVYRTRSLLARLEPLAAARGPLSRVSFGPALALLHSSDGSREAIELPSGRPLAMPLPGLIDVATAGPSAYLAVAEPDRLFLTKGKAPFKAQASVGVDEIHSGDGEVWLQDASGRAFRLASDGSFGGFDRMPVRPRANKLGEDPRWPLNDETPLERAVRRGVPIGDRLALVDAGGAMAWVNLASGELGEIGRRFLPDRATCRLFPLERDIVATCTVPRGGALFASGLAGPEPKIERSFTDSGVFFYAGTGTLLFSGPCSSRADEAGTLCLRGADGHWRSVRVPGAGGDGGSATHAVQRWLPKRDGGVIGVVESPKRGLLELPSGSFAEFTQKGHESVSRLARPAPHESLVDDAVLTEAGEIALLDEESVLMRRDGSVEHSVHRLSQLAQTGSLAVGRDSSGKLWQTRDWGRSWQAVAGPPSARPQQTSFPRRCSYVGCDFEAWYRIGFPIQSDTTQSFATAPPAPSRNRPPLPRLTCSPTEPARIQSVRLPEGADISDPDLDLGARRVQGAREPSRVSLTFSDGVPRVALYGSDDASGVPRLFAARLVEALATGATVRSARPPATLVLPNLFDGDRTAVPVLGRASADGWLALVDAGNGQLAIWLRADRPARIVGLGERTLVQGAAAQARGDELLLLTSDGDSCADSVLSIAARGSTPISSMPHRPASADCAAADAIGLGNAGELAVLRFPSGSAPPTPDDPALVFRSGAEPIALAPWSALATADAASCAATQSDEWRALIVPPGEWLTLALTGTAVEASELGLIALVRWSPSRLCLEAVELTGVGEVQVGDRGVPTSVAVRFGAKPEAGRRGVDFGVEYAEPLACKLVAPPR